MTLDLCHMPKPAKNLSKVVINNHQMENGEARSDGNTTFLSLSTDDATPISYVNLWEVKRVYGYFPFTKVVNGNVQVAVSIVILLI